MFNFEKSWSSKKTGEKQERHRRGKGEEQERETGEKKKINHMKEIRPEKCLNTVKSDKFCKIFLLIADCRVYGLFKKV